MAKGAFLASASISTLLPILNSQLAKMIVYFSYSSLVLTRNNSLFYLSIQLMFKLLYKCSQAKIPFCLSRPFEFTFASDQYALHDVNLEQIRLERKLFSRQKKHMDFTLEHFQKQLNGQPSNQDFLKKYVHRLLRNRVSQLRNNLKSEKMEIKFKFNPQSLLTTESYLEIKYQDADFDENNANYIHEYDLKRESNTLIVKVKEKKNEMEIENKIKKDFADITKKATGSGHITQGFKESLIENAEQEDRKFKLLEIIFGDPSKPIFDIKRTKFESYLTLHVVKGTYSCELHYKGDTYSDQSVPFVTKWLYRVNSLESQQSRKSIFPIKKWVHD